MLQNTALAALVATVLIPQREDHPPFERIFRQLLNAAITKFMSVHGVERHGRGFLQNDALKPPAGFGYGKIVVVQMNARRPTAAL